MTHPDAIVVTFENPRLEGEVMSALKGTYDIRVYVPQLVELLIC